MVGMLLGAIVPVAVAQKYTPPPPPLTTGPCVPTKKEPCPVMEKAPPSAVERFPFPGENPGSDVPTAVPVEKKAGLPQVPADVPQAASQAGVKEAPGPNSGQTRPDFSKPKPSFPFPGEEDGAAAAAAPAASGGEASSSAADATTADAGDADAPVLKDEGSTGSTKLTRSQRRRLPKSEDMGLRFDKDLEISHYYITTGNYAAAYGRAKDAVAVDASDPDGHLAVAEAARRLKKNDEAIAEYKMYLQLDPEAPKAKMVRKELADLSVR